MKRWIWIMALVALLATGCEQTQTSGDNGAGQDALRVARVVDGDTVELSDGTKVRYLGINTPERGQPFYQSAKDFNAQLVDGQPVRLEFDTDTHDQYGRALAHVFAGQTHVNLELVRQGYANVYTVPPNLKYSEELLAAQREAREHQRGLWAQSGAPVRITALDARDEWIEFSNQGEQPIDLSGYTLKDEANHIYEFGAFTLDPGQSARLHSGNGQNSARDLYWGLGDDTVWNNDGDSAYLRDPDGALVDLYTY